MLSDTHVPKRARALPAAVLAAIDEADVVIHAGDWVDDATLDLLEERSRRLIGVLETRLDGREWIMGENYTIADVATLGWVRNLIGFYEARELVGFDDFPKVAAWLERGLERPAVQRGLSIPAKP